ncbi:MAG: helix-turn-helix domain-containing protein [Chloroflexota bacterium]|nr:helix-turn-helix domain-containing protein [Chloroflexota bacterium]
MPDRGPLADYPEAARARALAHFAQLRPHLEDGVPLPALARQLKVPLITLQYRLRAYRRHGLVGLCRPLRTGPAPRRTTPELVQLIESLALRNPPPSAASIHRPSRSGLAHPCS